MLHPLRGKIEQLEPPQFEIQDHTVPFLLGQTGMEGPRRDFPRIQTVHLILHQRDEGRNDQGQPGQQGCRQLVARQPKGVEPLIIRALRCGQSGGYAS